MPVYLLRFWLALFCLPFLPLAAAEDNQAQSEVEKEYFRLLKMDDDAQTEVDRWIKDDIQFREKGAGLGAATLQLKIKQRFDPVKKAYENFIQLNPKHARARVAYGSFLSDINEEAAATQQWEKALELEPKLPAIWNNLGNAYGHNGEPKKAFEYYAKAIELSPRESLYHHNLATTVYLFRKDAGEFYGITETEVFQKAMDLYRKALELDPTNFPLASDLAQSYYGIRVLDKTDPAEKKKAEQKLNDEALAAWRHALTLARDDIEREGVYIHLARLELKAGRLQEARAELARVKNPMYNTLKSRITRNIDEKAKP